MSRLETEKIEDIIQLAIKEDIGSGDITTNSLVPDDFIVKGRYIVNEDGIIAGLPVLSYIFSRFGDRVDFKVIVDDGIKVCKGETVAHINGDARVVLSYERISLNFLQRLSGIATLTARFVEQTQRYGIKIIDTRKTTPGLRYMEKYAVAVGGGVNHRMGLYDQVLIKDNHLNILRHSGSSTGSIIDTVHAIRKRISKDILIEIEIDHVEEVKEALDSGVDIIMFDNMDPAQISKALKVVNDWQAMTGLKRPLIEVSGGITPENIDKIAQPGIDRIAIGALTHSAKALDISLEIG